MTWRCMPNDYVLEAKMMESGHDVLLSRELLEGSVLMLNCFTFERIDHKHIRTYI